MYGTRGDRKCWEHPPRLACARGRTFEAPAGCGCGGGSGGGGGEVNPARNKKNNISQLPAAAWERTDSDSLTRLDIAFDRV